MRHLSSVLAIAVVAIATVGCGATAEDATPGGPVVGEAKEGLTILNADVKSGVSGIYREGKRVVLFETARHVMSSAPSGWRLYDSQGVPVAISARFTDAEGRAMFTTLAEGAPPEWNVSSDGKDEKPIEISTADLHDRPALALVAQHAGAALARATLPERLGPERQILTEIAEALDLTPMEAEHTMPSAEKVDLAQAITGYREYFEVRVVDQHTCTRWQYQKYDGGWWGVGWIDNWNHGLDVCSKDTATTRGGYLKCNANTATRGSTSTYRNSTNDNDYYYTCTKTTSDGIYNGYNCGLRGTTYSPYCVFHTAFTPSCHNCKSDSYVQRDWVLRRTDSRAQYAKDTSVWNPDCN